MDKSGLLAVGISGIPVSHEFVQAVKHTAVGYRCSAISPQNRSLQKVDHR